MRKIFKTLCVALLAASSITAMAASATDVLTNLKSRIAPDKRTAIFDVKAATSGSTVTVTGTVGLQEQKDAIGKELADKGFANVKNNVKVLHNAVPEGKKWGIVTLAIASMRCEGKHAGEMATQGIMGQPVRVLDASGDWYRVQTPDNYISYVPSSSIACKTAAQMKAWREAKRYILTVHSAFLVEAPQSDAVVTDLVLGSILEYKGEEGEWLKLALPDGRFGWIKKAQVQEFAQWAKQDLNLDLVMKTAHSMMGHGYLWGGTSSKVTDCSGLVKVSYFSNGIILARDASQQALYGEKIKGSEWNKCKFGDLLFFGNKNGRVTHVGLYIKDGKYIHCSGRVKINSLDPKDPAYLYSPLSASRIEGQMGTAYITYVRNHPWYF
ncbi:MAG: NlpC/P60 family protein [Bacteroidales bacterium]|nr:NlpC/P60 family protein [Bacteroidales bacterium]